MNKPKRAAGAAQHRITARGAMQSAWQTHWRTARESLARLLRTPGETAMTVAVIGIALLLPSGLLVTMDNLRTLSGSLGGVSQISLYLQDGVGQVEAEALSAQLLARDDIELARYVSPEEGAADFIRYSGLGDILSALEENPLPGVIVLTPAMLDSPAAAALQQDLTAQPGVDSVQIDLEWVERLERILTLAGRASTGLLLILSLAVLFITGNTIRLAIEGRRAEIVVVKLVGGTDSDVALPFLYCGALYGLSGGLAAWVLLMLGLLTLQGPANELLRFYGSDLVIAGPGAGSTILLIAGGTLLGWAGAFISVKQHLAAIEPR
jgi:cell division transport system permease protein